ncbi:uncharacterized protein LOC144942468 [Lampetra fluviatilis]
MWPIILLLLMVAAPDGEAGRISKRAGDEVQQEVSVGSRAAHAFLRTRRQAWDPQDPTFWRLHQHFLHLGHYEAVFEMDAAFWALHARDPEASRRHYLDRPDPVLDRDPEADRDPEPPGRDDPDPDPGESEHDPGNREPGFEYQGRGGAPQRGARRHEGEEDEEEEEERGHGRAPQRFHHGDYGDY